MRGATRVLRISWDEAWHILEHAVARGRGRKGPPVAAQLGIDENAAATGHQHLTLVCGLDMATVEYIADDCKRVSLDRYFQGLTPEERGRIETVAVDMWEPIVQSVCVHVSDADRKLVFDWPGSTFGRSKRSSSAANPEHCQESQEVRATPNI